MKPVSPWLEEFVRNELCVKESYDTIMDRVTGEVVRQILMYTDGNRSEAARRLKRHRNSIERWAARAERAGVRLSRPKVGRSHRLDFPLGTAYKTKENNNAVNPS